MAKRTGHSAGKAEVNRQVGMAVKRFDRAELDEETWDFLCECGADQCKEWVMLTLPQYETILASGHELTRGQRARRNAQKLSDDAKALHGQSVVQHRRTGRNLGRYA